MEILIGIFVAFIVLCAIVSSLLPKDTKEQLEHGPINEHMMCPHCNTKGNVRTKPITQKKGVSGGKATAALLTGGISMLATGLSRKEKNTKAYCRLCKNEWFF